MITENAKRIYSAMCQGCVWTLHPNMLTTYSLRVHKCDTCGRIADCAQVYQEKKGTWGVEMECIVRKSVTVTDCTEAQARENPWEFAIDELEIDQLDWKVISVASAE